MGTIGKIIAAATLILVFNSALATAQPADIRVSFPAEDEIVRASRFDVLLVLEGDTVGAGLDHIHLQLDDGFNNTLPDLTGVFTFQNVPDGEHTLTYYMATNTHLPINGKRTRTFRVRTTGVVVSAPEAGRVVRSADVQVKFRATGPLPVAFDHYGVVLDGGAVIRSDDDDSHKLVGVADGPHTVQVSMRDSAEMQLGEPSSKEFEVRSTLNLESAQKAALKVQAGLHSRKSLELRTKARDRALAILNRMKRGGMESPADPDLTRANVKKVGRLVRSMIEKPGKGRQAIELLGRMSDGV